MTHGDFLKVIRLYLLLEIFSPNPFRTEKNKENKAYKHLLILLLALT